MPEARTVADVLAALPTDGSVLVAGASEATIGRLPYRLLASASAGGDRSPDDAGPEAADGAAVITTRESADRRARQFGELPGSPDRRLICGVDATPSGRRRADPDRGRWRAASPVDFDGTGAAVDRSLALLDERGAGAVHVLYDTLTTPLLSADSRIVARFAHHLTLQVADAGGIGIFPVRTNLTGDRDVARLKHLFDALVEVRRRGGERQVRCSGVGGDWREWHPMDGDAASEFVGVV